MSVTEQNYKAVPSRSEFELEFARVFYL